MSKKTNSFVFLHLIPMLMAGLMVFFAIRLGYVQLGDENWEKEAKPVVKTGYLGKNHQFGSELSLMAGLDSGRAIVLMGSSELTHRDEPSIPYHFIPKHTGHPLVAMGMGGNQSMCILAQLAALQKMLNGSKIVIILSPCWFYGRFAEGTSTDVFFDYISERQLYYIRDNTSIDEKTKQDIYAYLSNNYANLNTNWPIIKQVNYLHQMGTGLRAPFYYPFERMAGILAEYRRKQISALKDKGIVPWGFDWEENTKCLDSLPLTRPKVHVPAINWDSLYSIAGEKAAEYSSNNDWGVENSYYNKYVEGDHKTIETVPLTLNQEYYDYLSLLDFLKKQDVEVLFVMQPINPHVYQNLKELKPLLEDIKKLALDRGFYYLDLMVWEKENYELGTLKDIMHMGELGWLKTDREIIKRFIK